MSALVQKIGSLLRGDSLKTQVVLSLGLKGAGAALALCFNWAVAQLYGPLGSGLYGITQTTIVLLGIMAMGGMDYVTMRSVAGDVKLGNFPHALGLVHVVLKSASWLASGGLSCGVRLGLYAAQLLCFARRR